MKHIPPSKVKVILVCPTFHHTIVVTIALVSVSFLAPHLVVSVVDVKVEDIPGLYVCIALMGVISVGEHSL